jgi:hypothetical protein
MVIWILSLFGSAIFALWKGGRPEKVAGAGSLLAWVISLALMNRQKWLDPQFGVLGVDCIYLAVLLVMALKTTRTWLLFATAFQLLGVVIHLASLIDPGVRTLAYLRGLTIWSYLVLFSLVLGTWAHQQRRRRLGHG